ncbi:hypothetical protein [[Phormidium] sp. ETS-05]|uniref:hypothetical protein n=1 Tax=[Phormidium] sp. ETS-05 TaxID=222819 RepID=UPI0018EECE99|nr:hypothetical protein [[Phormidium] sp. ETS-05]
MTEEIKQIDKSIIVKLLYFHGEIEMPEGFQLGILGTTEELRLVRNFCNYLILVRRKVAALKPVIWEDIQTLELFNISTTDEPNFYFPRQSLNKLLSLALNKLLLRI